MRRDEARRPVDPAIVSAFDLLRQLTPEQELLQLAPTGPAAV